MEYLLLIIFSTLVDYGCGLRMARVSTKEARRKYLILSVVTNLGLLFSFKYADFAGSSLNALFESFNVLANVPAFNLLLPVGISFYTFQSMSYTIELYRGRIEPERHLGYFALYVAFFPQLVAGPIERPAHLLPQLRRQHALDYEAISSGLRLILWGYFLKLVVADRLAIYVDAVYANQSVHTGTTLALATFFFAFQIYGDFAGYSAIAIGAARLMGVELMQNFDRPYFASSIADFWRRWHISLSTWFRDYVYIPLGGGRGPQGWTYLNVVTVFVISGLWHGANWTFVCWGLVHGACLVAHRQWCLMRSRYLPSVQIPVVVAIVLIFTVVTAAWILFRSESVRDAMEIGEKILWNRGDLWIGNPSNFFHAVLAVLVLNAVEIRQEFFRGNSLFDSHHAGFRMAAYVTAVAWILLFGVFDGGQFIYFQF